MDEQDAHTAARRRPSPPVTDVRSALAGWLFVLGLGLLLYWRRAQLDAEVWAAFSAVAGVTLVDAACGWAVAVKSKRFTIRRLLDFLRTNLLPQTIVLFTVTLVAAWLPAARSMVLPAAGMMVAVYGIDIKQKLNRLLGKPDE